MKKLILLVVSLLVSSTVRAEDWCAGIRGNGDLLPAHWPALANLVERNGLPRVSSGGSSATVSMFFLDAIAGSPAALQMPKGSQRNQAHAFLIKSLPVFTDVMANEHGLIAAFKMATEMQTNGTQIVEDLKKVAADPKNQEQLKLVFGTYFPMLNPQLAAALQRKPEFFQQQLRETLKEFGDFDSKSDNLFVRHGLVDFKYFAILLGVVADFYTEHATDVSGDLKDITSDCASAFAGKSWNLADGTRTSDSLRSSCEARFTELVKRYVNRDIAKFPHASVFKAAGHNLDVLPTTSVIIEKGADDYAALMREYNEGVVRDYSDFGVNFKTEMWFGYWGKPANLKRVYSGLGLYRAENDLKSQKFMQLGPANWFEVLSVSPAEPGLANLQEMPVATTRDQVIRELLRPVDQIGQRWTSLKYRHKTYSSGGWSDLHPTLVLKAAGCENVVYLTRQDGDTVFGQQVFIRLARQKDKVSFWKTIEKDNNKGYSVKGTAVADSEWNRLYNWGNSESSFRRSVQEASAVYCTNWNKFQLFKGDIWNMIADSHQSPVFLKAGAPASLQVNIATTDTRGEGYPGCVSR